MYLQHYPLLDRITCVSITVNQRRRQRMIKMKTFQLSCCSTADLSLEHLQKRDIAYIPFHFFLDEREYVDDLGKSISYDEFYQAMADGASTRTSQVNVTEFCDYFSQFLDEGLDVLHVCLSSGISGVSNSAFAAQKILRKQYPQRRIYIVDSLGASSGYGLLMDKLADLQDQGMNVEQIYTWAEAHKLQVHHWFFSTDLTFYIRGGRISKTAGTIGSILDICPLLNMDDKGRLIPRAKIRTKKRVIKEIVEKMRQNAQGGLQYDGKCYISQSACLEDAQAVAALVEESFPHLNGPVEINHVGTTIGSHTGPGTVALFFWGRPRQD